ncbi:hypothetical protein [Flagellimonas beolgyonensis]|jgi:cytoskeletal protein CcmA (bactofilin family)|uniref:hypothetical protein n=1 Tax=Flagellimonas beolgyonensis TaxID=864064 RepID=UPI000F8E41A0|nr:hypothetical protein [Allomuricauda beolgyonensis]
MIGIKKIKAGALQFVLFIGAIIAVLLMAFVMLSHSHTLFNKKTDITIDLIQTTDRGMTQSFEQPLETGKTWTLLEESTIGIHTSVQKSFWGMLEKRTVVSKKGKLKFTKTGLVGHKEENRAALYLQDDNRPMVIAGDAKINGNAYLPERGIKIGNIQGFGYSKPQLVYGHQRQSKSRLPELEKGMVGQLKQLTASGFILAGNDLRLKTGAMVKNGFQQETQIIQGVNVDLESISLTGNIMVWASRQIKVFDTAVLQDVVLIAPEIHIADGVNGNFQALASEQITVGNNCNLVYPTILAVQETGRFKRNMDMSSEPSLVINSGSRISGTMLFLTGNDAQEFTPDIKIDTDTVVFGELFCEGYLELKGEVFGSVYTTAFIAMANGNLYLNHLYNGRIDASLLPMAYGGLVFSEKSANQVMKWLY